MAHNKRHVTPRKPDRTVANQSIGRPSPPAFVYTQYRSEPQGGCVKLRFWGVRGSLPVPGAHTSRYGGNTTCLEIRDREGHYLIVDAGTGIRELGNHLVAHDIKPGQETHITILLTHTHWDHVHGLPFFAPLYLPHVSINIIGPINFAGSLENTIYGPENQKYFPVNQSQIQATVTFQEVQETSLEVEHFTIKTQYLNHPVLVLGYRIEKDGHVVVTCFDTEPYQNILEAGLPRLDPLRSLGTQTMNDAENYAREMNQRVITHMSDADICVYDAQYTAEEYKTRAGWGHSSMSYAIKACQEANVKRLALFHHDPDRTDDEVDQLAQDITRSGSERGDSLDVFFARERLEVML